MKSTMFVAAVAVSLIASSCQAPPYQRTAPFDPGEYAPYERSGTASISGQAFMKTRGGDVKYGAGNDVYLNPRTTYSTEWYEHAVKLQQRLSPPDERTEKYSKVVTADGEGRFTFAGLPAGTYYIACSISWLVDAYTYTGGAVSAVVTVGDAEAKTGVILR
jgi:hypothetical protein